MTKMMMTMRMASTTLMMNSKQKNAMTKQETYEYLYDHGQVVELSEPPENKLFTKKQRND